MEFEAFPPTEEDFSGIRCLLQQVGNLLDSSFKSVTGSFMVSGTDSGSIDPGSSPSGGHCLINVLGQATLLSVYK